MKYRHHFSPFLHPLLLVMLRVRKIPVYWHVPVFIKSQLSKASYQKPVTKSQLSKASYQKPVIKSKFLLSVHAQNLALLPGRYIQWTRGPGTGDLGTQEPRDPQPMDPNWHTLVCICYIRSICIPNCLTGMHYGMDYEILCTVDGTFVLAAFIHSTLSDIRRDPFTAGKGVPNGLS